MTEPTFLLDALAAEFERHLGPIRRELAELREEVARLKTRDLPQHLTVPQACHEFGLSKSLFYQLLADKGTKLAEVVFSPPGTRKTLVITARMKAWVDARRRPERSSQGAGARRRQPHPGLHVAQPSDGGER